MPYQRRARLLDPAAASGILVQPSQAATVCEFDQARLIEPCHAIAPSCGFRRQLEQHDAALIRRGAHRPIGSRYGRIVGLAPCEALFAKPVHPYTEALIAAAPVPDPTRVRLEAPVEGEVPSPINPPKGCAFHPRCPLAIERCRSDAPPLVPDGRVVACHVRAPVAELPAKLAEAANASAMTVPAVS